MLITLLSYKCYMEIIEKHAYYSSRQSALNVCLWALMGAYDLVIWPGQQAWSEKFCFGKPVVCLAQN